MSILNVSPESSRSAMVLRVQSDSGIGGNIVMKDLSTFLLLDPDEIVRRIFLILFVFLFCVVNTNAWAGIGMQEASKMRGLAREGDQQAVTALQESAQSGDAVGQFVYGQLFDYGYGVRKSSSQAVLWYRRAAKKGYAKAQNMMGIMYERGRGVGRNTEKAAS